MKRAATLAKATIIRKIRLIGFMLLVVGLCGSDAFALDPMGPPTAELEHGKSSIGIDYSRSEMDVELTGGTWIVHLEGEFQGAGRVEPLTIKDFETERLYANLGWGFARNWEAFLRLGAKKGEFGDSLWEEGENFDSSTEFAVGGGLKTTFYQGYDFKIGGLAQASWAEFDGKLEASQWLAPDFVEFDLLEVQVAIGVTYMQSQWLSIYGGPFAHFMYGDFDYKDPALDEDGLSIWDYSWDTDEDPVYGGYVGARIKISKDFFCNIEYQQSPDAKVLGASLMLRY